MRIEFFLEAAERGDLLAVPVVHHPFQKGQVPDAGAVGATAEKHGGLHHEGHQSQISLVPGGAGIGQQDRLDQDLPAIEEVPFGLDRVAGPVGDGRLHIGHVGRELIQGQYRFAYQHRRAALFHLHRGVAVLPELVGQFHRQAPVGDIAKAAPLVAGVEEGILQAFLVIGLGIEFHYHHVLQVLCLFTDLDIAADAGDAQVVLRFQGLFQGFLVFGRLDRVGRLNIIAVEIDHRGGRQLPFADKFDKTVRILSALKRKSIGFGDKGFPFYPQQHPGDDADLPFAVEDLLEQRILRGQGLPFPVRAQQEDRFHRILHRPVFVGPDAQPAGHHPAADGAGIGIGDLLAQSEVMLFQILAHIGKKHARSHRQQPARFIQAMKIQIGEVEHDLLIHRNRPPKGPAARCANGVADLLVEGISDKLLQIIQVARPNYEAAFDVQQGLLQTLRHHRCAGVGMIDIFLQIAQGEDGGGCAEHRAEFLVDRIVLQRLGAGVTVAILLQKELDRLLLGFDALLRRGALQKIEFLTNNGLGHGFFLCFIDKFKL